MDVRTDPLFGVGVAGVVATEACRRVFTLDILLCHRSTFPRVLYLAQL